MTKFSPRSMGVAGLPRRAAALARWVAADSIKVSALTLAAGLAAGALLRGGAPGRAAAYAPPSSLAAPRAAVDPPAGEPGAGHGRRAQV